MDNPKSIVDFAASSQAQRNWSTRLLVDAMTAGYFTTHFAGKPAPRTRRQRFMDALAEARERIENAWSCLRHGYPKYN